MAQLLILLAIALPVLGLMVRFAGFVIGTAVGILLAPFVVVITARRHYIKREKEARTGARL